MYRNASLKLVFKWGKYLWGKTRKTPEGPLNFKGCLLNKPFKMFTEQLLYMYYKHIALGAILKYRTYML